MSNFKSKSGAADSQFAAFELSIREVNGQYRPATGEEVISAARRAIARRFRRGTSLTSPSLTRDFLRLQLAPLEHEIFACVFVDLCGAAIYVQRDVCRGRRREFLGGLVNITERV